MVQPPESAEVRILPQEDWSGIKGKPLVQGQNSPVWISTHADCRMSRHQVRLRTLAAFRRSRPKRGTLAMVFPVGTSPGSRPSSIGRTGTLVFATFRCVRSKGKGNFSSLRREGARVVLLGALLPVVLVTG